MATQIKPEVLDVLNRCTMTESSVILPEGQLDRKLYVEVNKVLANAGGKWNRKAKAHLFTSDPREKLGRNIEEGSFVDTKRELQAFFTPSQVAKYLVEMADVEGKDILEPSAGIGNLVKECLAQGGIDILAIEINPEFRQELVKLSCSILLTQGQDFLRVTPEDVGKFKRIVANPPFTKNQAILHLKHMLEFLADDGILVCILPDIRGQKKYGDLIQYINEKYMYAEEIPLPAGSFKESGTMINTFILRVRKPIVS